MSSVWVPSTLHEHTTPRWDSTFGTCKKTSILPFIILSYLWLRLSPLLAYPKLFMINWCIYGHNTVRHNLLALYWINGLFVAPEKGGWGPGDYNTLGFISLGTWAQLATCTYSFFSPGGFFVASERFSSFWRGFHSKRKMELLSLQQRHQWDDGTG